MSQAKWYELTPARKQLLAALVVAILVFLAMLRSQLDTAGGLQEIGNPDRPANGPAR